MVPPHSGPLTLTAKLNIVEHLPSGSDFLGSAASLFFVDVIFFSMVSRFFLRRETKARGSVTVAKHQQKLVEVSNFWHCSTGASVIKDRCTRNSSLFFLSLRAALVFFLLLLSFGSAFCAAGYAFWPRFSACFLVRLPVKTQAASVIVFCLRRRSTRNDSYIS